MITESYKNDPLFLAEKHILESNKILVESCQGLSQNQKIVVEGVYNDLLPLIRLSLKETSLTADQIKQLFGNIEQQSTEQGGNRTLLGKGADVVKKADQIINNVGKWLADTTPVKMADQKFDQLKAKVGEKFPDLDKQLTNLGTWMKENPGKSAAIIGVMTALAGLAGGPLGGAIAGQVLRGTAELIKGEKLSTAAGKGIKTAAYGAIAGWLLDGLGDWLEGLRADVVPYDKMPGLAQIDVGLTKTLSAPGMEFKDTLHSILVPADQVEGFKAIVDTARSGDVNAFNDLLEFTRRFSAADYLKDKAFTDAATKAIALQNDAFLQTMQTANDVIRSAAQGAIAGKLDANQVKVDGESIGSEKIKEKIPQPTEALVYNLKPLNENMVALLFKRVTLTNEKMLGEGLVWEKNDPAQPKQSFMQKVMGKASEIGKNITTKVTASKLMSAWKKAGSPVDSDALADFLKGQGVNDQVVGSTYQQMQLPPPGQGAAMAEIAAIKKEIANLGPETRKQIAGVLAQKLGAV